ncbi:MAG: hypothetical protein AB7G28_26380 [Pirellulales bacterium]
MPHYASGNEAKIGDIVKGRETATAELIGIVESIQPSAETCNMQVRPIARILTDETTKVITPFQSPYSSCCTCKEFEKIA